jgi:hypothetical protein
MNNPVVMTVYSSVSVFACNTFQDLPLLRETADNTESQEQYVRKIAVHLQKVLIVNWNNHSESIWY